MQVRAADNEVAENLAVLRGVNPLGIGGADMNAHGGFAAVPSE